MADNDSVELSRDCDAVQIPAGNEVTLKAGTLVDIAQTLGGSFTVHCMGALFRIAGKDADALGREAPAEAREQDGDQAGEYDEEKVWAALKTCFDPEIPVNIVDLGLVYDLRGELVQGGLHKVTVKMTLTAPGCGMGPVIARDAQSKILEVPGVADASVEVVWDPPWHQSMISPAGRKILGME
jgi:probable FeS assembly SUF system protein SufT